MTSTAEPFGTQGGERPGTLGIRLRQARLDADLSLRDVARQLGVSPSFVSQLENGKSQPSVATLYALTQLLGVSMDGLFEAKDSRQPAVDVPTAPLKGERSKSTDAPPDKAMPLSRTDLGSPTAAWSDAPQDRRRLSVTTPGDRTRLVMDWGVTWDLLVRKTDDLDFMEIMYPPQSSSTTDGRMLRHDDYEYGFLLEGELQVTLGFDVFMLRAGEALGFDSTVPHLFRNLGTTPARGVWVVHHRHE